MRIEPQDLARMDDVTGRKLIALLTAQFDNESEAVSAIMRKFGDALEAALSDRRRTLELLERDLGSIGEEL